MTLNGHFALKSGSLHQYIGVLAFGENCSEICRATHRLSAATKIYPTGDISVTGVCIGVTEEEASNQ